MKPRFISIILVSIFCVAGCHDSSPIVSARFAVGRELSARQVAAVNNWLETHRAGWGPNFATPPVPAVTLVVRQRSGKVSTVQWWDKEGWMGAVLVEGRLGQFDPSELAELRRALSQ